MREMREKTGLDVELTGLLDVYSCPDRDPRQHTLSVVFTGTPWNPDQLRVGDDAKGAAFYPLDALPAPLAFDHARVTSRRCWPANCRRRPWIRPPSYIAISCNRSLSIMDDAPGHQNGLCLSERLSG
ncbi:hypothetical protein AGMMS49974_01600 [Deltaproteobacteria bacterium]|nr:hypothetical protein AGMMS49974_01600 [Deltaproteobacteria bacterium]